MEENKVSESRDEKYTSALTRQESLAVLSYLPVHIWFLPLALYIMMSKGLLNEAEANLLCYAIGFGYMLMVAMKFLRRDFDPLCDRPVYCLVQIGLSYAMMLGFNLCVAGLLSLILGGTEQISNPNNASVMELNRLGSGGIKAMAIFLAPLTEELMFRGGVFGVLRRYNRIAAYAFSMLAFSLYHVWAYAMLDPLYWLYILQYLPVSWLLCRCYERTESIWCPIFFHMLVNAVSLEALSMLEGLV